tara:strand:- start:359 stop:1255 length:897 start_codon:yes stop_codon:yes gene_type:complete
MFDGIVSINKPSKITSFKTVSEVKKKLCVKKAGHGGTLDPLASGVLLVFLNRATKFSKYALDCTKEYLCKITFGQATNTFDLEGKVTGKKEVPELSYEKLKLKLSELIGEIIQTPPKYSAVKIKGKPSYYYARKNIEITLKPRKVFLHDISIKDWNGIDLVINVTTSKGFYIRTLADEIGKIFDSLSYLSDLKRTRVGPFQISNSIDLQDLLTQDLNLLYDEQILKHPDELLQDYGSIQINDNLIENYLEKKTIDLKINEQFENYKVYNQSNFFLGTANYDNTNSTLIRNELYKMPNS